MSLCFPSVPVKWNKTDHYITFPNGSEYWFGGLDDEKRLEKILGREFSTMHFNEITQMNFASVQLALTRLAQKNELKKKAYYDFNPSVKTHWSYDQFIRKLDPRDSEPLKNPDNYVWMRMNPSDNLENIDSEYLEMLESMPEAERVRFLLGEFTDESDGQVYYSFRPELHIQETTKSHGSLYIFMDFNVSPMTATIAQYQNNCIVVHDEIWLEVGDTYKMCDALIKKSYKGMVIPDSTGRNRKTSGQSDFDILKQHGFQIPHVMNPAVWDRVNNVNRLFQENRIIINPRCKKLINDLQKVVWKNNSIDQSGANKMLSHISDGLGYGCNYLAPIGIQVQKLTASKYR